VPPGLNILLHVSPRIDAVAHLPQSSFRLQDDNSGVRPASRVTLGVLHVRMDRDNFPRGALDEVFGIQDADHFCSYDGVSRAYWVNMENDTPEYGSTASLKYD